MKRQRIMVVLDRNESEELREPALQRGVFLAKEMNAALELFVSEPGSSTGDGIREALAWLQGLAEPLIRERLAVTVNAACNRHQAAAIMDRVSVRRPDMLIKATRHESRFNRTLFNDTDWYLIRHCPCPLLLAKSEDDWNTRRIVACVDPAHVHAKAETLDCAIIELAQALAYRLRGELHILHSIELLPQPASLLEKTSRAAYKAKVAKEHEALLDELLRPYGIGGQRVHVVRGRPERTIVRFVQRMDASLVVMGAVSKGRLETLFIGNTAEKVLDDLSCDILVVKSTPLEVRVTDLATCPA